MSRKNEHSFIEAIKEAIKNARNAFRGRESPKQNPDSGDHKAHTPQSRENSGEKAVVVDARVEKDIRTERADNDTTLRTAQISNSNKYKQYMPEQVRDNKIESAREEPTVAVRNLQASPHDNPLKSITETDVPFMRNDGLDECVSTAWRDHDINNMPTHMTLSNNHDLEPDKDDEDVRSLF